MVRLKEASGRADIIRDLSFQFQDGTIKRSNAFA